MKALLIVDIQNDFLPKGALPVHDGDKVIPIINKIQDRFDLIVATQDWHPQDHGSFATNYPGHQPGEIIKLAGLDQILWPAHCVQGTQGSDFAPGFDTTKLHKVVRKGTDKSIDSYSTFFDNARRKKTDLEEFLREKRVTEVFICGLATDYCVKFSTLDALDLGFTVYVIVDACRGVDLQPGDVDRAIEEMRAKGARLITSKEVPTKIRS